MAKKKTTVATEVAWEVFTAETPENTTVTFTKNTEVTELEDTVTVVEKKRVKTKEEICEFYWIRDDEILDPNVDLSKYNLKPEEEEVLFEWSHKNVEVNVDNIKFNMYTCSPEVRAIIEKYGISPRSVVTEWWLSELTEEEKDIIVDYYNELVKKL